MTSHYLKQCWLVYWCKNASLGLNELRVMIFSAPASWLLSISLNITNKGQHITTSEQNSVTESPRYVTMSYPCLSITPFVLTANRLSRDLASMTSGWHQWDTDTPVHKWRQNNWSKHEVLSNVCYIYTQHPMNFAQCIGTDMYSAHSRNYANYISINDPKNYVH